MSYNVTISGKEYKGIDRVKLPITDENTYAEFYSANPLSITCGRVTSFESEIPFMVYTDHLEDGIEGIRPYAFYGSGRLERVSLPNATYIPPSCFEGCIALTSVNIPLVDGTGASAFANCSALEEISIPSMKSIQSKLFNLCSKLKKVDSSVVASIAASAFNNCSALEALILRNTTMATLANTNAFLGSGIASGTGYIYVPSALVDSYKAASNWSNYAAPFRAIEDYPDICG